MRTAHSTQLARHGTHAHVEVGRELACTALLTQGALAGPTLRGGRLAELEGEVSELQEERRGDARGGYNGTQKNGRRPQRTCVTWSSLPARIAGITGAAAVGATRWMTTPAPSSGTANA